MTGLGLFDLFGSADLDVLGLYRSLEALCGLGYAVGGVKTGSMVVEEGLGLRRPVLLVCTMPGEYEERDVGVEPRLHTPGDSEYLVEGVLAEGKKGVGGGGRFCESTIVRRLANSAGPLSVVPFSGLLVALCEGGREPVDWASEDIGHLGPSLVSDCVARGMTKLSF